ncbi:MAG TPA: P-loop NTPase fold protein [Elusimicrobiales bacterium]|nr:P-loop NTPase fold protein [Elusimicrobiales bacterium]
MTGKIPLNRIFSILLTLWLFIRFTSILFAKYSVTIAIATTSIVFAALITATILNLVRTLSDLNVKKKSMSGKSNTKRPSILTDIPINDFKHDLLGRKTFVKDIFKQIENYNLEDSLVIGIYGSLGEGKTSTLNLLKDAVELSGKKENYILIDFKPWHYKDETAITQGFFYELKTSMRRGIFDEAGDALKKYSQILQFGAPKVALHRKLTHVEESLGQLTQKINNAITKQGKKIIIFIDEIEMLAKPAMLKLFELIQSSARFKNTIYILSFDIKIVSKTLAEEGGISFIEKTVQLSLQLPAVEKNTVREFLYTQIDNILKETQFPPEKRQSLINKFTNIFETKFEKIIKNLRDAKFFLNSFKLSFSPVRTEVNVYDFLILTLIRVFFPSVYEDICKNPNHYIMISKSDKNFPLATEMPENAPKLSQKVKALHIEEFLNSEFKNDDSKMLVTQLLLELFPVKCDNKISHLCVNPKMDGHKNRICHLSCFAKYFMSKTLPKKPDKVLKK